MKRFARVFLFAVTLCTVAPGCVTVDNGIPTPETASVSSSTANPENPFIEATPFQQPKVTETEILSSPPLEATATETVDASEVKRDANGNILPNSVGEWTKLPQGENQRILIGPEGSNIVLELDSRLGLSEFMFNNGENDYFTKDGKTPQDRIYEAVNNSLYYYWCSTQGGGCAFKPADMKGVDIDFWSYKNHDSRGNIRIDNGVTFKIMPMWDKIGGAGNWIKLTDGEKAYKNAPSLEELSYGTSPEGGLIFTYAIDNVDKYKEWPFSFSETMVPSLSFLSAGWNLHDKTPMSITSVLVEDSVKNYPGVGNWISITEDWKQSTISKYFFDRETFEASKYTSFNVSIFLVR